MKILLHMCRAGKIQFDLTINLSRKVWWYYLEHKKCIFSHLCWFCRLLQQAVAYLGAVFFSRAEPNNNNRFENIGAMATVTEKQRQLYRQKDKKWSIWNTIKNVLTLSSLVNKACPSNQQQTIYTPSDLSKLKSN